MPAHIDGRGAREQPRGKSREVARPGDDRRSVPPSTMPACYRLVDVESIRVTRSFLHNIVSAEVEMSVTNAL
jgi:hypothetical protein